MFGDNLLDLLKDLGQSLKKAVTSRVAPFVVFSMSLFGILLYHLFMLQIVNGESYTTNYTMKAEKTVSTTGTRGNIYDKNGVLLAYSELSYSVIIGDSGYYDSADIKNSTLNSIISKMITIIEDHGDKIDFDFPVNMDDSGAYVYNISDNTLLRFLRDVYGYSAISDLSEDEKTSSAKELVDYLKERYEISSKYSDAIALKIIYIRYNLAVNSYARYISFTVASDVSQETMAAILENSDILTGVTIQEDSLRKYNYSTYIAHIIGYTGKINETELEDLKKQDSSYTATDVVGKAGIEAAYETTLAGTKGKETMLVDSVGRVLEVTSQKEATAGEDVYLTIDVELQKKIYTLLERRLAEVLVSRIVNSDATVGPNKNLVIPIKDVYAALINNSTIDMDKIATSSSESAVNVYASFTNQKTNVLAAVEDELNQGTEYNALSSDMQSYIKLARKNLMNSEIINVDAISSTDPVQEAWLNGTISLHEYLEGAISNDWINIYNLDVSDYPTKAEVLEAVIAEAMNEIQDSDDFDVLIYEYLINNSIITGRQVCLILMEQDAVAYTDSEYLNINNGGSTYDFLIDKINKLEITPAQLALDPCSGSTTVEDPNTGAILALVSYPSYDINYFSGTIDADYYAKLLNDKSTPLVNRATQTTIAPGSTFKPLMAIAGLTEGVISATETVDCDGVFDKVTPELKCWIYPDEHGSLDAVGALAHSCNVYFCEIGYRLSQSATGAINTELGLAKIQKYAEMLGLSTKSGIQISEATPHVSDYNPIASSIGQGTNAFTSLNLARYISTIANEGTVYDSTIISKIQSADGSDTTTIDPVVASTATIDPAVWDIVHEGMRQVISTGVMDTLCKTLPVTIAGKSGTAQEDTTRGDHACYVMFSTNAEGKAELVTTVMIPYGYAATNAGIMAYYAMASYYGSDIPSNVYFSTNNSVDVID